MDPATIASLDQQYVLPTYRRQPGLFVRGQGVRLYDAAGNAYMDFLAGIAVNQLGHCHPAVVNALATQAQTLIHTSNHLLTAPQAILAEKLHRVTGCDKAFFANCGTTAVETALKIARKHGLTKRPNGDAEVISLHRSFHGRTMGALSATAQGKYQDPFRPLLPGFRHIPANDLDALREAVGPQTSAVIVEPIQGEGGLTVLSRDFLQEVRRLCTEHDAFMIDDEVQTGMGRTGHWLAIQRYDIVPDLVCLAKGLGSGVPIGACLTYGRASDVLLAGEHGSTFGGNALVCAVANAVVEAIEQEGLLENAHERGRQLAHGLRALDHVVEVRGDGLMRGAILDRPIARDVVRECLNHQLIINATDEWTLRLVPPLIVTEADVSEALAILALVLSAQG